jgi:hypothetical protein
MLPRGLKNIPRKERSRVVYQHFKELEEREPDKFRYLIKTPMLNGIHHRAYEAVETPELLLKVKAEKIRLNRPAVTPAEMRASLAHELKISVPTLYRRYGRETVKKACEEKPILDEAADAVRHQLSGYRVFKRKTA